MAKISLFYDEELLKLGLQQYITWETTTEPHIGISGITGTGKTTLAKLLLARIGLYFPDTEATICDFKGDSAFSFLDGCSRYYKFDQCLDGFNCFYSSFLVNQKNRCSDKLRLIIWDEWAGFLNFLPKKESDDARSKLANLLMLGRSLNYHVILSQQRFDAENFSKARDNFSILVNLGNPSKEVQDMIFHDFKDKITNDRQRGTGFMLLNGSEFRKVCVPTISNMSKIEDCIKVIVNA